MQLNLELGPRIDQDPQPWKRPGKDHQVVAIPVDFFLNGWVLVLTDSEIAAWLMFRDFGQIGAKASSDGFTLFADDRLAWYDLSKDVWEPHAVLGRMGLMTAQTSLPAGIRRGELSTRWDRVQVTDDGLRHGALTSALAAVAATKDGVVGLEEANASPTTGNPVPRSPATTPLAAREIGP